MKNLLKALASFQNEVPVIHKATQGYGYSYADLPTIFEKINPLLKKHGLSFYQTIELKSLRTVIFHVETGETLESYADIPQGVQLKGMNDFQVLGSAITYMRRYALSCALGLVTDKDTDASGEQVKETKEQPKDERAWLNKGTTEYNKAVEAVKAKTVTIAQIEKKYRLSKEIKTELNNLTA